MQKRQLLAGSLRYLAIGLAIAVISVFSTPARAANWIDFPTTTFQIYSEDGSHVVGHSRYFLVRVPSGEVQLRGENHYTDGQYDEETETLAINPREPLPRLQHFSHVYYSPKGSLLIAGTADIRTGKATCIDQTASGEQRSEAHFDFPPDTYAGASMLIPIEHALRMGITKPFQMHFFDCTPKPRLMMIESTPKTNRWPHYPGKLMEVEAKPDLGWIDILAAPFLPVSHVWFDPAEGFSYVGGGINRYFYSKQRVILVKVRPNQQIRETGGPNASAPNTLKNDASQQTGDPAGSSAGQSDSAPRPSARP